MQSLPARETVLQEAFSQIIISEYTDDHYRWFQELLELDTRCFEESDSDPAVGFDMLKLAATCDQPKYVYRIFEHWAQIAERYLSPNSSPFRLETAKVEEIRDHLRADVPIAKGRILFDMELAMRGSYGRACRLRVSRCDMRRSEECPFIIEIHRGDSSEEYEYAPDDLGELLEEAGILSRRAAPIPPPATPS